MSDLELAQTEYETGNVETAMRITKGHLRHHKNDGRAWELIGLIQYSRERFAISVSALERASLLVPLRPAARVCLAFGYARIDRKQLSTDLLIDLTSDTSLPISLLLQVATGLDSNEEPGLAMRACRVAARRDPDHPQPYYDLSYYAARCGYPPHVSESLARKAISLDPANVCYRVGLASLLLKMERTQEAIETVNGFSNEEIQRIECRDCLERIVSLFQSVGDLRRVVLCQQQLLLLEAHGDAPECR